MNTMALPTLQQQNILSKLLQPFPSNIRHINVRDNTLSQLPGIPQQPIQRESVQKSRNLSTKWNFLADTKYSIKPRSLSWSGWSGAEAESIASVPLVNPKSAELSRVTQPIEIGNSNNKLQIHKSIDNEKSNGEPDISEVVHTKSQLRQVTASNDDVPILQGAATPCAHNPVGKEQYNEIMTCGVSSKDDRLFPETQPIEALGSSICGTAFDPQSLPIRTKIESSDSKKYSLRRYGGKPGLYYSSTIWPEELPFHRRDFLFGQLRIDLNNHIQKVCKERKYKRAMKKNHVSLTGQAFTIELRLSGNIDANGEDIELRPTIWVLCASELYKKLVDEALSQCQLSWALDERIEVVKGLT
ncbi:hypothetical protein F5Y03DRAFT_115457 [Xylaria venustula]|nr:hypothetical protein F5Y03DRAFT_115457 [Xylaria venustula]